MRNIRNIVSLFLLPALLLVASTGCSSGFKKGDRFEKAEEFEAAAKTHGLLVVGRFEDDWPAEVVSVTEGRDGVEVDIPKLGKHDYSGFEGYSLQALVFKEDSGDFSGIVLRSAEKTH